MEYIENLQLKQAFDFIQYTGKNIFLTGKAGTGKTTFLKHIKEVSPKRMIVVAPTGVAAINAGGVTIHSFFQMPFGPHIPVTNSQFNPFDEEPQTASRNGVQKFSREKINIIKSLDLLVIDEISMVRADLLDGIDEVLRRYRNHSKPFGGIQLLMIGDIQQLAPIAKDDEWEILKRYYDTVYFFSSKALRQTAYISIELKHIFRQSDREFIDILNKVRDNRIDNETLNILNKRYIPNINKDDNDGYITLTTHNHQSQRINDSKLQKLKSKLHTFKAVVKGEFPEYSYPTDYELQLKVGAQVMFVKNDSSFEKLYYNGKIGTIVDIDDDLIHVKCEGDSNDIAVTMVEWQNYKYTINDETSEISETVIGSFIQYPLKLAWAITIHKSQGLTFEK
ncbi:MAG TPA: AAA family ATPase, partial [Tenuifilaceae bacterium]|nr:AAA family ATPase [Tenuifilaceae bacterium]